MLLFKNREGYVAHFRETIKKTTRDVDGLEAYVEEQIEELDRLLDRMSTETFWEIFPRILGVDARLTLFTELIIFDDFSNEEIIRIIENDYRNYSKELCGYKLDAKVKPSMIFNIV